MGIFLSYEKIKLLLLSPTATHYRLPSIIVKPPPIAALRHQTTGIILAGFAFGHVVLLANQSEPLSRGWVLLPSSLTMSTLTTILVGESGAPPVITEVKVGRRVSQPSSSSSSTVVRGTGARISIFANKFPNAFSVRFNFDRLRWVFGWFECNVYCLVGVCCLVAGIGTWSCYWFALLTFSFSNFIV